MDEPIKVSSDPLHGESFQHEAYGVAQLHRYSGTKDLFMVDYPQAHFMGLSIHLASLTRNLSNDWVHPRETIVEVEFSEVQWARFISSAGEGAGVPCTLNLYRDPKTGDFKRPEMHSRPIPKAELFADEVTQTAKDASNALNSAIAKAELMANGGALKKGDLNELRGALAKAKMELGANLPFVVQQAEEAIGHSVEAAKGEIDAYQQFATARLGRLALAEKLMLPEPSVKEVVK
jgi:hypothetical protein